MHGVCVCVHVCGVGCPGRPDSRCALPPGCVSSASQAPSQLGSLGKGAASGEDQPKTKGSKGGQGGQAAGAAGVWGWQCLPHWGPNSSLLPS